MRPGYRRAADPSLRTPPSIFEHDLWQGLAAADIEPSVGSRGDSYNNALAETIILLFKTEVIHHRGPWKGM